MLQKVLHTFITSLLIAGTTFLTTSLLSGYFGAAGVGEVGVFLFVCSLIAVLSAVFGSSTIVYVLPKYKFNTVFTVSFIWALLSSLLFTSIAFLFHYDQQHTNWLIGISIIQSIFVNNLSFLLALNKIKAYNLFRLAQPVLLIALFETCHLTNQHISIDFYLMLIMISYVVPTIISLTYLSPNFRNNRFNFADFKKVVVTFFSFGGVGQLTNLFQQLNYRVSYFILALFWTKSDIGAMVLALTFVDGIWLFKNSISLLKYVQTSINEKTTYSNSGLIKISFIVTLGLLVTALLIPNPIYVYFFGRDFSSLKTLLMLMSPGILCMTATSVFANYFAGLGKVKFNLASAFTGFVVSVPFSYLLIKNYGIFGAAIANNIPLITGSFVTFYLRKRLKTVID